VEEEEAKEFYVLESFPEKKGPVKLFNGSDLDWGFRQIAPAFIAIKGVGGSIAKRGQGTDEAK